MGDTILKSRPDTITYLRKLYNFEHQKDLDQAVDLLQDWLKKQFHLSKREYSREYLERSIILMKGSVEKTKSQINKLCALRSLLPKFFENCDARNDYDSLNGIVAAGFLPQLTEDHYRVYTLKVVGNGLTKKVYLDALTFGLLLYEYAKKHDYFNGLVVILDYRDINITEYLSSLDATNIHSFVTIITNGYKARIKSIHVIISSKTMKSVVDVLKKLCGAKLASRFHVHDDVGALYEYIPKPMLPSELGGDERSLAALFEETRDTMSTKENIEFFKEMKQAVSSDANTMKSKINVLDQELAGTFRSLTID